MSNILRKALILLPALLWCCTPGSMSRDRMVHFTIGENSIPFAAVLREGEYMRNPRFFGMGAAQWLSRDPDFRVIGTIPDGDEDVLIITERHGIYLLHNFGERVTRVDSGLPREIVYPYTRKDRTKPVAAFSVSADRRAVALIVPSALYLSVNGGRRFARRECRGLKRYTELLTVAVHPRQKDILLLGSSTGGIYYSTDGGLTVKNIRNGVPGEPVKTPNFLEEVRSLCFGGDDDTFYAGFGNGNGIYRGSISRGFLERIDIPGLRTYPDGDFHRVDSLSYAAGVLWIGTNRGGRKAYLVDGNAYRRERAFADYAVKNVLSRTDGMSLYWKDYRITMNRKDDLQRDFSPPESVKGKRGLYISYSFTQGDNYPKLLSLLRHLRLNAVVINMKDDYGRLRVPSKNPLLLATGAVMPYRNIVKTIARLKRDGVYVIARHVTFLDERLYRYRNFTYAMKSRFGGRPFEKGPEMWVDAFSDFAQDYNIETARAIADAGADEIQFDYIRFPDVRGDMDSRGFHYRKEGQTMREALVSFLKKAKERLRVPISIDLFGFNAIYKWGEWIGQDITEMSRYVDAVSPMFYPSHYTGGFAIHYGDRRIYYTILLSCKRLQELTRGVHYRPFLQAFYYRENEDGYCVD